MAGSSMAIELIVHSPVHSNDTSSTSPNFNRSECTGTVNDSLIATQEDLSTVDRGALIEEERNLLKLALRDKFRAAVKDHRKLKGLIANVEDHPVDAWRQALLWASAFGYVDFITEFFKRRPPGLKTLLQAAKDHDGFTTLHRAVIMGQQDVVKVLTRSQGQNAQLMEYFEILHARTPEGWTSLHLAVVIGDEDMVQILMDSYNGLTPTLPPDYEWDFADNFWMTPLQYAVLGNWHAVMKQLLDWPVYDRHVNACDYYMRTAAHMACCSCTGEASIDILVKSPKVDINVVDCCLYTPLHWAVHVGATETVRCLVSRAGERTIRITEEDIEGRPVLQTAIEHTTLDRKVCKDIGKLLLTCAELKDEVERLYRDRQVYVDASNAILVSAALIASVSFGGWLQPPGGNLGGNVGQADRALQVFWAFNSLSFFFSIATVMAGAGAVLPMEDVYIGRAVRNIRGALGLASFLLIVSVVFVLGAFGASGFTSLASTPNLVQNMVVTTSVGSAVCIIILLWFLQRLYKIRPDWRHLVSPAIKKCFQHVRRRHRVDLVDIQTELEGAEVRARKELQNKYGKSAVDGFHHSDWTDLVFDVGKAVNRASQLRRVAHDRGMLMGIADEKGGPISVRHLKERVLEQRILAFEEVYENARKLRTDRGRAQDPSRNMLILSHVGTRGLHHWIDEFPSYYCRRHSLEKDATRWASIHGRVVLVKKPQLEEENTKFEYGLDFDESAV